MQRQARIKSFTGIYHLMIRGINKEQIFNRVVHKNMIIEVIKNIREDIDFDVIAYCIMDNHLHLLIKVDEDKLETLMKKLNIVSYREVAELCNLSFYKVSEISKKLKAE